MSDNKNRICIIGAGPAALLTVFELSKSNLKNYSLTVFESSNELGSGMPYSRRGACAEHVTNVSSNELPKLPQTLFDWVQQQSSSMLSTFNIRKDEFHEKEVIPRLLFGQYLESQFGICVEKIRISHKVTIKKQTKIVDIENNKNGTFKVMTDSNESHEFDSVIICTGHKWVKEYEGIVEGFFDSPYPPSKLPKKLNHKVIIRGSSLTSVDAIKTMSLCAGRYLERENTLVYERNQDSPSFEIELHSRGGLLPALRVHMDEPHMSDSCRIDPNLIEENRKQNQGFVSLDFLYKQAFLETLKKSHPKFFSSIENMSMENFVEQMLSKREAEPAFNLLKREYNQSLQSIRKEESVPWKEALCALSFAMNYPAKYLSAEDMLRLKNTLMPLISVIIAFLPQSSCEILLALHEAGVLTIIDDCEGGKVFVEEESQSGSGKQIRYEYTDQIGSHSIHCKTFVDCIGQKPFDAKDFPYHKLLADGTVTPASLKFCSKHAGRDYFKKAPDQVYESNGEYYLKVPGIAIDDSFRAVQKNGCDTVNLFILAVPYIGGYNPDYSGLDFCEQAAKAVVQCLALNFREAKRAS